MLFRSTALGLVTREPGRLTDEYGGIDAHLTALHKKGLVRRERAGRSYRYWPVEVSNG